MYREVLQQQYVSYLQNQQAEQPAIATAAATSAAAAGSGSLQGPLRVYVPAHVYPAVLAQIGAHLSSSISPVRHSHHVPFHLHVQAHTVHHTRLPHHFGTSHFGSLLGGGGGHSLLHRPQSAATSAYDSAAAAGGGAVLAGVVVGSPYPPLEPLQQKRLAARRHNVTYVYDFPAVFEAALRELWAARAAAGECAVPTGRRVDRGRGGGRGEGGGLSRQSRGQRHGEVLIPAPPIPSRSHPPLTLPPDICPRRPGEPKSTPPSGRLVEAVELVLPPQPAPGAPGGVGPCCDFRAPPRLRRAPPGRPAVGANDCGMVVWHLTLHTPECSQVGGGREGLRGSK